MQQNVDDDNDGDNNNDKLYYRSWKQAFMLSLLPSSEEQGIKIGKVKKRTTKY